MKALPNGCRVSDFQVYPSNWNTKQASLKEQWYIRYRFYDPRQPKPKQKFLKGMNRFTKLSERQAAVRALIQNETEILQSGYNPFTETLESNNSPVYTVGQALDFALAHITVAKITRSDIAFALKQVKNALLEKGWNGLLITDLKRGQFKSVLEAAAVSPDRFNKLRSYMMILMKELVERDIIQYNLVRDISPVKVPKKIRQVLTDKEVKKAKEYLQAHNPTFYRFMQIFFHSGSRISELLRLKVQDINLSGQFFRIMIYKGNIYREELKAIKDVALPYWEELLRDAPNDHYVFSKGLKPGPNPIRSDQINKRWHKVKEKLEIEADFYSLKHLHTDQVAALLSLEDAGRHNSHRGQVITMRYAIHEKDRQLERIKKLNNTL